LAAVDPRQAIGRREGRPFRVRGKEGGIGDDGRDILRRDVGRGGKGEVKPEPISYPLYISLYI